VERPDGTRDSVAGATMYRFGAEPGVYRLISGDSTVGAFAVNAPAAESDLTRLDGDALSSLLPGWDVNAATSDGAWRRAMYRERLGSELWRPLLIALLVVLVMETLLAASGRTRRSSSSADAAEIRPAEAEAG
jgi:hypothetical protein